MRSSIQLLMLNTSFPLLFLYLLSTGLQILFLYFKVSQNIAVCDALIQQPSIILELCINFIGQSPLLKSWPFVQWNTGEHFGTPVKHVRLSAISATMLYFFLEGTLYLKNWE